jgi:hypothetical protein
METRKLLYKVESISLLDISLPYQMIINELMFSLKSVNPSHGKLN